MSLDGMGQCKATAQESGKEGADSTHGETAKGRQEGE